MLGLRVLWAVKKKKKVFFSQTGGQQMAKTISVLYLSSCKDWRIWHTTSYNPQPYPTELPIKKDKWPLL